MTSRTADQKFEGDLAKLTAKTKSMCSGCEDDFYNYRALPAEGCWKYESAKVVSKQAIHVEERPPYSLNKLKPTLSCYHVKQFVHVMPEQLDMRGFWNFHRPPDED